ncbi:hypothetical protein KsCSTR_13080 [Candidatus Kuenenia stuttgartiensis]|nr:MULTISPECIES: ABC-three component system protein [Kuenenia]MBE7545551.1 hypothetical protein [Planctomycetia bacterium]MCF6153217.1 hypothetical protein [Candidatus Kuenenia stuttgartiensis]MCL4727634.1 hypothetical protein [Candidatus Kuenenia stuttgartiensis]MCZ7623578.1 hypothetical protein [Candidatus Kuenenia sp.]QII10687.1 hypothetical protein KsCSTR_13080 [Candidatus Kuenenia stuttgartiensis]
MKSNAPGQLLGYTIQFPRALYHLLRSGPGDAVCVEVRGDVATLKPDGGVITEEDKSSIVGNPLTDKSTDLWKTFSNWIKAITSRNLGVGKTKFILYCNQSGRSGIVDKFSSARNQKEAQSAIDDAKKVLNDIKKDHDIWEYYDLVVNQNESLLVKVVERFELQIGSDTGYDNVRYEIRRKHVPVSQIEFLMDQISGWLQKVITEKIAARELAIISWEKFDQQFLVLFNRARCRELVDFTLQYPLKDEDIQSQVKVRPVYLKQLDVIGTTDDDILEAVSDFLRADVNRERWIESGIIDEDIASDFETKLNNFWKNQRIRIDITEKSLSEEDKGQLLFRDCKSRAETIRDMSPPCSTIAGTYHALTNKPVLGWHPNWEKLFPKQKED